MIILGTIGKYDEALVYYKEVLDTRRSILGKTHPSTVVSINNMGNVLNAQSKRNCRNKILLESIYDYFQCILLNILIILGTTGKYDEALVYYKEALDASRSILGNSHPDTVAYIGNVGNILCTQGDVNKNT